MTFDELYPEAVPQDLRGHLLRCQESRPCWHCGRGTYWADIHFESHLCSKACVDAKWQEYWVAASPEASK